MSAADALHDPSARAAAALASRIAGRPAPRLTPGQNDLTADIVRLAGEVQELRMDLNRVKRSVALILAEQAESS